jgi:hypothetical protein
MLHDKYLPEYDVSTSHRITIEESSTKPLSMLEHLDVTESFWIKLLYRLRGITPGQNVTRSLREMFIELERRDEREIIFGLVGQFWKPDGNIQRVSIDEFKSFNTEGFLKPHGILKQYSKTKKMKS